ncbi:hypothetical protein BH23PLA1_BH23PLA1_43010 [soil metagenome]
MEDADFNGRCLVTVVAVMPFILAGLHYYRLARRLDRVGVQTRATVVAHENAEENIFMIVKYEDSFNILHRMKLLTSDIDGSLFGETLEIVYDPDVPDRANTRSSRRLKRTAAAFVVFGVVCVFLIWLGAAGSEH